MYDVIIAGAGPAGSTCARRCAQQGLKTLLLDKDAFPRPKPCAGAVSEQALSYLDFSIPEEVIERECFGARVHILGRSAIVRKKRRIAVLVSRDKFDSFLVRKAREAGAEFRPGEKVLNVAIEEDWVEAVTEKASYRARFLIGADGVHSRVARAVRPPFARDEITFALVSPVRADNETIEGLPPGTIDMYFGAAPLGYGWVFPHDGYYSVGIGGLATRFSAPRKSLERFTHSLRLPPQAVRGHFIPLGGKKRKVVSNRVLLVGDAAGFADPFHGEGIVYAIRSGTLAAEAVTEGIKSTADPVRAASRYQRACERSIRKDLRIALFMAKLFERFPDLFRRVFIDNKKALEKYLDIAAGRTDYRRYARWLIARVPFYLLSSCARNGQECHDGFRELSAD